MFRWVAALTVALAVFALPVAADHYRDGYELQKQGKYQEAIAVLDEGLTVDPGNYNLSYLLGYCYTKLQKYNEAIEPLRNATKVRPDSDTAFHLLGFAYMKRTQDGQPKPDWYNAGEAFRQASLLKPDNQQFNYLYGLALASQQKYSEAVAPLEKSLSQKPGDFSTAYQLGLSYYKQRRYADAISSFEKARASNANHKTTLLYLGESLVGEKRYADAVPVADKYVTLAPEDYLAHNLLGKALLFSGKYAQAGQSMKRVTELKPSFPQGWYYFGQAEENRIGAAKGSNFSSAIAAYKKAVELNAGSADYIYKLAHAYDLSGGKRDSDAHDKQAVANYSKCIKLNPNHARAKDRLARVRERIAKRIIEE